MKFRYLLYIVLIVLGSVYCGRSGEPLTLEEATIGEMLAAIESGSITCVELTEMYLRRIETYDQPTRLNSLVVLNPDAVQRARELDEEFARTGKLRPLHGIPMIIKDNYDTKDLQTAGGSIALQGSIPPDDSYQVRVLREAGIVILGKSNMAEWAFNPYITESSIAGVTRNPYDLERVPAGSSGGTAAAVAANFGAAGLGTDTGNSIRGPSSHCCLVGIRSTIGLTSRDGIIPLYLRNDVGGPMARTVEDAARILGVIAGYDPADSATERARGNVPESYLDYLKKDGLQGKRIGIMRRLSDTDSADPAVHELFGQAIATMQELGAEIVDPFDIPGYNVLSRNLWKDTFRIDVNRYFASLGPDAPVRDIAEIVESGQYSAYIEGRLRRALRSGPDDEKAADDVFVDDDPNRAAFRDAVIAAMDDAQVDAVIYPTWNNPPRKIGDMESPAGNNSQQIPPPTGQPALTVPMGFTHGNLPAGLQILGRPFDEPVLIEIAYAYEQATHHRRPSAAFPAIDR